jgi:hypothetical protein
MSSNVAHYHSDGANRQVQAVLAMFQFHLGEGLESSWSKEFGYEARIDVARWENCREQGYILSCRAQDWDKGQLHIAFFEHRNSDEICAIKWNAVHLNTPTINDVPEDAYPDKWTHAHTVGYGKVNDMARWLYEEFEEFWEEGKRTVDNND